MHALLVAGDATRLPTEVHQALARRGHDVTSTLSMQSALAMQRVAPADILVVDWNAAKASGHPLQEELLRTTHDRDSAVLAVVDSEASDVEEALRAGANDYLSLPLAPGAVEARLAVVERWLEQLRAHRAAQAEAAHAPLDPEFRAVLDACPEPICMHRQRKLIYANPALASSLSVDSASALLGRTVSELVHPDDRAAVEERLSTIERTGRPAALREERFVARDGSLRVGEAHSFLIQVDDGPAIVSLGRDLTERRELEAQFRHSSRLASVGSLAASVAHELNNPLTLVLCNLSDLGRTLPSLTERVGEPLAHHLERRVHAIEEAAQQMRALARDLTDFVRTKEAQGQRLDLRQVVEKSLRMAAPYAKDHGNAQVHGDLHDVGMVEGSETRLLQVFLNILLNAVDAMHADRSLAVREIVVSLRREGSELVTRFADTGPGVPPELRARIFESYFSTKAAGQGTGLGLAVARSIVESLHGTLRVVDADRGATFEVRLPAAPT